MGHDDVATIRVSAVVLRRADGAVLTVRKTGTAMFMFPGGKHELGESPLETAVRELLEETGLVVAPEELVHRGRWETAAANEPGRLLVSEVFELQRPLAEHEDVEPTAEIAQISWLDPASPQAPDGYAVAPLLLEVFPRLVGQDVPAGVGCGHRGNDVGTGL